MEEGPKRLGDLDPLFLRDTLFGTFFHLTHMSNPARYIEGMLGKNAILKTLKIL